MMIYLKVKHLIVKENLLKRQINVNYLTFPILHNLEFHYIPLNSRMTENLFSFCVRGVH